MRERDEMAERCSSGRSEFDETVNNMQNRKAPWMDKDKDKITMKVWQNRK